MKINKFIILVLVLVGLFKPTMAQPIIKDSNAAYSYWAHRGIIEMVHAYMNDYFDSPDQLKSIEETTGKKEYESLFIKEINKESLPDFEKVSAFLIANNWAGTEKKILQPLIEKYKKSLALNAEFFEVNESENKEITISKIKTDKWNKKQIEIIDNYEKDLSSIIIVSKATVENIFEFIEPHKLLITSKMIIGYSLFVLVGILMGALMVFLYSKRKINSILREEKIYYMDYRPLKTEKSIFQYITLFHILKRRKDSYKKHNQQLKIEIESLELENFKIKKDIKI